MAEKEKKTTPGDIVAKVWEQLQKGRLASLEIKVAVKDDKSEEIALKYFERLVELAGDCCAKCSFCHNVRLPCETARLLSEIDAARAEIEKERT